MQIMKRILAFVGVAALLAGCASTDNQGAMGNDSQVGYGSSSAGPFAPNVTPAPTGPSGSVSRTNPFGEQ
jgi:hypothetical protein